MGNHRADRRGPRRRPSDLPTPIATSITTAGKRRAEKPSKARKSETKQKSTEPIQQPTPLRFPDQAPPKQREPEPVAAPTQPLAARVVSAPAEAVKAGARQVSRHAASRGPLFRGMPSPPVLLGVAALAISAGGALTAASSDLGADDSPRLTQASALSGASDVASVDILDRQTISRDSRRDALDDKADAKLVAQAEDQLRQRNAALAKFAQQAEQQAAKLRLNQWVLPLEGYDITATFGQVSGLWSSYHTGLDFAAPSGTPIRAIANGVISSVSYDGAYGNKTVLTLEDGTELWFCHQTSYTVSEGQEVRAGDVIGYVGSTGNVTGPHLHLEVRPGAGDPVDPYEALVVHGLQP